MKLVRFGPEGNEKPGIVDADGKIRDLSSIVPDIDGTMLSAASLQRIRGIDPKTLPVVQSDVRLGACVNSVGSFIAIGLNYIDHAEETSSPIPDEPVIFFKARTSICGPNDATILPMSSDATDWEVELAVVIGSELYDATESEAMAGIAGYCVCQDLSERKHQLGCSSGQWGKGKSFPTFGPLGPWLVTTDEIDDVQNLPLWLDLNGRRMQSSNTGKMIFPIASLVSYTSRFIKLLPGDVITTGTPPGVGLAASPPHYLKPGDVVELSVAGLGQQRHEVLATP